MAGGHDGAGCWGLVCSPPTPHINSDNKVPSRHVHRELVGVKVNRGFIN